MLDCDYSRSLSRKSIPLSSKCELCSSTEHLLRHHVDYDYPEIIVTVCSECHSYIHKDLGDYHNKWYHKIEPFRY